MYKKVDPQTWKPSLVYYHIPYDVEVYEYFERVWVPYFTYGALEWEYVPSINYDVLDEKTKCRSNYTYDASTSTCKLAMMPLFSHDGGFN